MHDLPLKYSHYDVVFQEVPSEISLAIEITGCPHRCTNCHSKFLWDYTGRLLSQDFDSLLNKYSGLITCVCFMGGDQNLSELYDLCQTARKNNLKTCLYTGLTLDSYLSKAANTLGPQMFSFLNYLKVGPYIQELGGLNSKTTNQRFYKLDKYPCTDITEQFQKEHIK